LTIFEYLDENVGLTKQEAEMSENAAQNEIVKVPENFRARAYIKSREEYQRLYKESIEDSHGFWGRVAEEQVDWFKKWDTAGRMFT